MITPSALLTLLLPPAFVLVLLVWAGVSLWLVVRGLAGGRRRRTLTAARASLATLLEQPDTTPDDVRGLLDTLPEALVLRLLGSAPADPVQGGRAAEAGIARLGLHRVVQLATTPCAPRHNWQRIAALRILAAGNPAEATGVITSVAHDRDVEIGGAALALLARTPDRRAGATLIEALKEGRYPPSRIATYLDQFPLSLSDSLRPLLHHPDEQVRYWGATLLSRQQLAGIEVDLAALSTDPSPLVRRAAVASLVQIDRPAAARIARLLLDDGVWYVRAHAARALAEAEGAEAAEAIAPLLADREWWVRVAAKESLEHLGEEAWSVLVPFLSHEDAFARNGAAEVLQNIGVLDSLIVLEAATSRPSAAKLEMLRRISAAGGTRMTEALLERVDADARPRVRSLLRSLGLEPAGVQS